MPLALSCSPLPSRLQHAIVVLALDLWVVLSLNVSPVRFGMPQLVDDPQLILAQQQLDPASIFL